MQEAGGANHLNTLHRFVSPSSYRKPVSAMFSQKTGRPSSSRWSMRSCREQSSARKNLFRSACTTCQLSGSDWRWFVSMTAHHTCPCALQEFSEEDYIAIVNGWREKLKRSSGGDQRWGLFYATRDWLGVIALRFGKTIKDNGDFWFPYFLCFFFCLLKTCRVCYNWECSNLMSLIETCLCIPLGIIISPLVLGATAAWHSLLM